MHVYLSKKKKQAVYVVSISAGDKERNTLAIKKIIIMDTLFVFFEGKIVNLATYRQFTNAAWDSIIKKKKNTKTKTKYNNNNNNNNKSGLSRFLFLQQKM